MQRQEKLTRRELLGGASALALAPGLLRRSGGERKGPAKRRKDGGVRNIVFMVSDGMSAGVPALAEPFSRLVRGRGTDWYALVKDGETRLGYLQTDSLSSMVTDSSAASSAWGSGSRVCNGSLNVLPDGRKLTPIGHLAKGAGMSVGLVTTTTVTHATPAGFASVQESRGDEEAIALDYLDVVDVALGGGEAFFSAARRSDNRDVYGEYRSRGYKVCRSRDELLGAGEAGKVVGCFSDGHLPYTIDQLNGSGEVTAVPSLAEMTAVALDVLEKRGTGFLLQIEGGRVDHAAHANDAAGILWEQVAFDDAIGVVGGFVEAHPETLVVVTTDHGNSNPGLIGMGARYSKSTACFERLKGVRGSFTTIHRAMRDAGGEGGAPLADEVGEIMSAYTGITIADDEAAAIAKVMQGGRSEDVHAQHRGIVGALGQTMCNHVGIGWTGTAHTADLALTAAFGAGRERLAGLRHHTDVFGVMTDLMGVEHENARMAEDEGGGYVGVERQDREGAEII